MQLQPADGSPQVLSAHVGVEGLPCSHVQKDASGTLSPLGQYCVGGGHCVRSPTQDPSLHVYDSRWSHEHCVGSPIQSPLGH